MLSFELSEHLSLSFDFLLEILQMSFANDAPTGIKAASRRIVLPAQGAKGEGNNAVSEDRASVQAEKDMGEEGIH